MQCSKSPVRWLQPKGYDGSVRILKRYEETHPERQGKPCINIYHLQVATVAVEQ